MTDDGSSGPWAWRERCRFVWFLLDCWWIRLYRKYEDLRTPKPPWETRDVPRETKGEE